MSRAPVGPFDVIVVGSGVAGLATALGLAGRRRVALITTGSLGGGSTAWAQGGLAAALDASDSPDAHAADTMTTGCDIGDEDAVRILTETAPGCIEELVRLGARLDRDDDGRLALTREGGHSARRIVHAGGDASGAEVSRALTTALLESDVELFQRATVQDVLTSGHPTDARVTGVGLISGDGERTVVRARAVVLATGGVGGLYETTTNPPEVAGVGLGLALRAGATLVDLEFVQFHPTALCTASSGGQVPLITEALRGEGAALRDELGRAVMAGLHPLGDLAPRDVVARRIDAIVTGGGRTWLDATGVRDVEARFPTIAAACRSIGIDPQVAQIPVVPTQHFMCGGVRTDTCGATDVAGLYAVGEVAATGVHGSNRLASNSLVEGLAFGRRVAAHLADTLPGLAAATTNATQPRPAVDAAFLPQIRRLLSDSAGIRRTGTGLAAAATQLAAMASGPAPGEAGNEWLAASAIVAAAAARRESRGCHWRSDYPDSSEAWQQRRVLVRLGSAGMPIASTASTHQRERQLERTA